MQALPLPSRLDYNPFDQAHKRDPYATWADARAQTPVFFSPVLGMWVVTRYDDIVAVLRDPATFSSGQTIDPITAMPPDVLEILATTRPLAPTLINNDPPTHTRIRALCNKAFTPQRVAALEGQVRRLATDLIEGFAADGRADIVDRFAFQLPRIVIGDLVGVPREDVALWGRMVDLWASFVMEDLPHEARLEGARATVDLHAYNDRIIAERTAEPRDDLLSALIQARLDDGAALSVDELSSLMVTFLVAGHNTVTDFIGNALLVLTSRPEVFRSLAGDDAAAAQVVEEVLRFESPSPGLFRVATRDVELGGAQINAGTRLYLLYASANRDADAFADPDTFDPARGNLANHLAMGRGIHYCIGAHLARMEGRVALQELSRRLPDLQVVPGQTPDYKLNPTFRGPLTLEVTWTPPPIP